MTAEHGSAVLLISHDLGVVGSFCDRLMVMYAGRIVESGRTADVLASPAHPYTRALLASLPSLTGDLPERLASIPGTPPHGGAGAPGCAFAPRCPLARPLCRQADPPLLGIDSPDGAHHAACHAVGDDTWNHAA